MNQFLITYSSDFLFSYLFKCLLCLSHIYLHISVFRLVDVCHWQNYKNLTDAGRQYDYVTVNEKCDNLNGWYRFQGAAGTKMVTTCPPMDRCNAVFPIWLNGSHPTVAQNIRNQSLVKSFHPFVSECFSYYVYSSFILSHSVLILKP